MSYDSTTMSYQPSTDEVEPYQAIMHCGRDSAESIDVSMDTDNVNASFHGAWMPDSRQFAIDTIVVGQEDGGGCLIGSLPFTIDVQAHVADGNDAMGGRAENETIVGVSGFDARSGREADSLGAYTSTICRSNR